MVNKRVQNAVLGCNLKNDTMISVCFQGLPFNITVIQAYARVRGYQIQLKQWTVVIVQLLSCIWLFVTPGIAAHQASLSYTVSWSLFKFMNIITKIIKNEHYNQN